VPDVLPRGCCLLQNVVPTAEIPSAATERQQSSRQGPLAATAAGANGRRILESTRRRSGAAVQVDRSAPTTERVEWESQQRAGKTDDNDDDDDDDDDAGEDARQRQRQWQKQSERAATSGLDYGDGVAVELQRRAGLDEDEAGVEAADEKPFVVGALGKRVPQSPSCSHPLVLKYRFSSPPFFFLLSAAQVTMSSTSGESGPVDEQVKPVAGSAGDEDDTEDDEGGQEKEAPAVALRPVSKARASDSDGDQGDKAGHEREDSAERAQKKAKKEEEETRARQEVLERMRKLKQDAQDKKAKGARKERRGF
jgi:hypothetical protein